MCVQHTPNSLEYHLATDSPRAAGVYYISAALLQTLFFLAIIVLIFSYAINWDQLGFDRGMNVSLQVLSIMES